MNKEAAQRLFNYMSEEHGVTLLDTDMQEIERILCPELMEEDEEFEKITGFKTKAEFEAYEKGREHEQAMAIKFIEEWDGSRNSPLGELLYTKTTIFGL